MTRLMYVMDPMCSWCWAFRPVFQQIVASLPPETPIQYIMGGLAPDSNAPMTPVMRQRIEHTWKLIEQRTGAEFNFDFWRYCQPRRSTYPACRAVIAAGLQDPACIPIMIEVIQRAYYLEARNPSDDATLIALAAQSGLDPERFVYDLASEEVAERLQADLRLTRYLGVEGFPTLLFEHADQVYWLATGYTKANVIQQRLQPVLSTALSSSVI